MRVLYHFWLSPFCRKARMTLSEKGLDFELAVERFWERRHEFLARNPAGQVPVLVEDDGPVLADSQAIVEYLEEIAPEPPLIGSTPQARAECRRITASFDQKFYTEVTDYLLTEKLLKRFMGMGEPQTELIRIGTRNMAYHLDYISYLSERRNYLAGERFTLADIAAAAQLSCLDYLGSVAWEQHGAAKDWYARVKSRPCMRAILGDHVAGLPPPKHYANLDF